MSIKENKMFKNPILSGFYPDPSVCRVGADFYLVNSTFAYFPGVPIFHSKDLVHWEQIGNVLDRKSQLEIGEVGHSAGIYAPTIRYHEGVFYMITTNIGGIGNFYVTATNPAGPWSEPIILDADGIDPSLFFDDDGKVYYIGTKGKPEGISKFWGDNDIWMRELDIKEGKLVGEEYVLWNGAMARCEWAEGPHLYKIDGYYYLMIAEGGTGHQHAITIARSKHITGPYEGHPGNPILTHRHLGQDYPIVNVGHGDLVDTPDGSWWMVALASRPYGGYYRNLGRETFLVPVVFENGWPVVNKGKGLIEEWHTVPGLPTFNAPILKACEHFERDYLDYQWLFLRTPRENLYSLTERKSYLRLYLKPENLREEKNVAFVGIRQRHMSFSVSTAFEFTPQNENETAGVVLIQNNNYHFRFEKTKVKVERGWLEGLRVIKCENGKEIELANTLYTADRVYMRIIAREQQLTFIYGEDEACKNVLIENVDATILSTDKAGGFVGTCMGMYGSGNGTDLGSYADFDWFEYMSIE